MPRWAVVRVAAADGQVVQRVLVQAFAPITMRIDTRPSAAAPEWEFAVQDRTEADLRHLLDPLVLASKTVLDPPLMRPATPEDYDPPLDPPPDEFVIDDPDAIWLGDPD